MLGGMLANVILELGLKTIMEFLNSVLLTLYRQAHHNGQSVYLNLFHTSYGFQDSATATSQAIIDLHNDLMFFLVVVVVLISYLLGSAIYFHYLSTTQYYIGPRCHGPSDDDEDSDKIPHLRTSIEDADLPVIEVGKEDPIFNSPLIIRSEINHQTRPQLVTSLKNHDALLEIVWTIVPAIILIAMIAPSFALIYSLDEVVAPLITLKITGRQWYWSYDYTLKALPDEPLMALSRTISKHFIFRKRFDSIMLSTKDLFFGEHRLLEVNRKLTVPAQIPLRLLITASDVLHSWAVPAMGAKIDACPGRLNQTSLFIKREGVFYGQCSEICGIGHGFMPVVVQTADLGGFYRWFSRYFGIKFVNPQRADLIPHMRHALQRPSITDNELIEVWEKFVTKSEVKAKFSFVSEEQAIKAWRDFITKSEVKAKFSFVSEEQAIKAWRDFITKSEKKTYNWRTFFPKTSAQEQTWAEWFKSVFQRKTKSFTPEQVTPPSGETKPFPVPERVIQSPTVPEITDSFMTRVNDEQYGEKLPKVSSEVVSSEMVHNVQTENKKADGEANETECSHFFCGVLLVTVYAFLGAVLYYIHFQQP